jgi:hypothetical protein
MGNTKFCKYSKLPNIFPIFFNVMNRSMSLINYPFPVWGYYLEFTIRSTSFDLKFVFMLRKHFRTFRHTCDGLAKAQKLSALIPLWIIERICPEAPANIYADETSPTVELFLSKSRNFWTEPYKLLHVTQYTHLVLFGMWVLSWYYTWSYFECRMGSSASFEVSFAILMKQDQELSFFIDVLYQKKVNRQ